MNSDTPGSRSSADRDRALQPPEMTILADHAILRDEDPEPWREGDAFGLVAKLGAVFDILRHRRTQTPIAVAVCGDWGTGKSSAMRWLREELRRWNDQPADRRKGHALVETVWFDPWKYHSREDVWRGLIAEVIVHCIKVCHLRRENVPQRLRQAAKQFGRFLGRSFLHALANVEVKATTGATEVSVSGEVFRDVIDEFHKIDHPEKAFLNDFEATLTQWVKDFFPQRRDDHPPQRLAVFIDDLDRCLPEVTLEVLEALKLYLNIPGLMFVVGLDRQVVDAVVRQHYAQHNLGADKARHYLDKMFQVEIDIPPSARQVAEFLRGQIDNLDRATDGAWARLLGEAGKPFKADFRGIIEGRIGVLCESNPREVKRLLNSTLLRAMAARLHVGPDNNEALAFAQGAAVFLIGRFLRRGFEGLDATWLIREPGALDFFAAYSAFRQKYPKFIPSGLRGPTRGEAELPGRGPRAPEKESEQDAEAERAFETLLKWRPLDREGHPLEFDKDPHLFQLMGIPFDRGIAEVAGVRAEEPPGAATEGQPPAGAAEERPAGGVPARAAVPPTRRESGESALAAMPAFVRNAIARSLEKPVDKLTSADLERVTNLDLEGTPLSEVGPLAWLTRLIVLDLTGTHVSNAGPLARLTDLVMLSLMNTRVSDAGPLGGLSDLEVLYLNQTQASDISPLAGLSKLTYLNLSQTPVSDVGSLGGLSKLQWLYLSRTQVSDVGPLAGLSSLQELVLRETPVSDVGPLAGLSQLKALDLRQTKVSAEAIRALRKKLPRLSIYFSKVGTGSSIEHTGG